MGWDTALTVSFTGSILISRDGSATVAVNHHQLRRVFQHPSALLGVVTMVCPLVEVRHRGSAFVSRYSTIRSHREESERCRPSDFHLASPRHGDHRPRPIGNFENRKSPSPTRLLLRYQQDSWFPTFLLRRRNFYLDDRNSALLG